MSSDKLIAFHSHKIINHNRGKGYTVTEKELSSIVETLKGFRTTLLGQQLNIYTDHKNIIWKTSTLIECYGGCLY